MFIVVDCLVMMLTVVVCLLLLIVCGTLDCCQMCFVRGFLLPHRWMAVVLGIDLPRLTEFESSLCNGVFLCGLGEAVLPSDAMWTKVYDRDQTKFKVSSLGCVITIGLLATKWTCYLLLIN